MGYQIKIPETKFLEVDVELGADGFVSGYASIFGEVDQGGDTIAKGAFSDSLRARRPKMLFSHDHTVPIGVWDSVVEDEKGLKVTGRINIDTEAGKTVHSNLKFGSISGLSIGYRTKKAVKVKSGRLLQQVDLWEVSFVTFPMQETAGVTQVKQDMDNPALFKRFVEKLLREAHDFSSDEVKAAAAAVARVRFEREAEPQDASELLADLTAAIRGA